MKSIHERQDYLKLEFKMNTTKLVTLDELLHSDFKATDTTKLMENATNIYNK